MELKTIKGFQHYEVSEQGKVFRKAHVSINGSRLKRKQLKPYEYKNGYQVVYLHDGCGKRKMQYIHRLVYQAFIGEIPPKHEIDHIDCNRGNNMASNLRAVSHKSNCNNPKSIERYKICNSLDKGKFNREKMIAAKSGEYYDNAKRTYHLLLERDGKVKIMELMKEAHIGYYRALKLIGEMKSEQK